MQFRPWIFVVLFDCLSVLGQDPCDEGNYHVIADSRRSAGYENDLLDTTICDRFVVETGEWYRFINDVGSMIPESTRTDCIPINRCLTFAPIWMDGTHPTVVGETETKTVCANEAYDGTSNVDFCCAWEREIQVKLCPGLNGEDNYYVYQLVEPYGCYMAYCGGTEVPPCEVDFVLEEGVCVEKCPIQAGDPVMSDPVQLTENPAMPPNNFEFTCTVNYPTAVTGLEKFEVVWLLDGDEDPNRPPTILDSSTGLTARILGTQLEGKLGKTIQCRVRSFRTEHIEFNMCQPFFSGSYRMEIIPVLDSVPPLIIGNDVLSTEIFFVSTIPPTCFIPQNECSVGGIAVRSELITPTVQDIVTCEVNIFSTAWDPSTNQARSNRPFVVQARRDMCALVNEPQNFVLDFEQVNSVGISPFEGFDIADIQFHYQDISGGMCESFNDPRIKTFDGHFYPNFDIGQFYMVRQTAASGRVFEVQVRHWSCFRLWPICDCAVAVREGNTVYGIDHCRLDSPEPFLIKYSPGEAAAGAGIFKTGSNAYKICMPSGVCTEVTLHGGGNDRWINIYIEALPADRGNIEGLCGNFDGNIGNDVNIGVESFRIPEEESFFKGHIPVIANTAQANITLCTCVEDEGTAIQCGPVPEDDCGQNPGTEADGVLELDAVPESGRRRKRDTSSPGYSDNKITLEDLAYEFDYGENHVPIDPANFTWPTESGKSQEDAESLCEADIRSAVNFEECLQIVGQETYDSLVAQCVDDFKLTDNIDVSGNIWSVLQKQCLHLLHMGVDKDGNILPRDSPDDTRNTLIRSIESGTCPGRCSNHGSCENSVCTCDENHIGTDCSVEIGTPPNVTGIRYNGLCDVEARPCQEISLTNEAGTFAEVSGTVCEVVPVEVDLTDLSTARSSAVSTEATFVNGWEIKCDLPESAVFRQEAVLSGFWVSVSYDGQNYSPEKFLTIYDSVCMQCTDGLQSCSQKDNTCVIEGRCYLNGDSNEEDDNFECHPDVHSDQWTCVSHECQITTTRTTTEGTTTMAPTTPAETEVPTTSSTTEASTTMAPTTTTTMAPTTTTTTMAPTITTTMTPTTTTTMAPTITTTMAPTTTTTMAPTITTTMAPTTTTTMASTTTSATVAPTTTTTSTTTMTPTTTTTTMAPTSTTTMAPTTPTTTMAPTTRTTTTAPTTVTTMAITTTTAATMAPSTVTAMAPTTTTTTMAPSTVTTMTPTTTTTTMAPSTVTTMTPTTTTTTMAPATTTTAAPATNAPTTTTESQTTTNSEGWGAWSTYGTCTKTCDYGLQTSTRNCLDQDCVGESRRDRLCNTFNCLEKDDEQYEGVKMTILTSLLNVALIEEELLKATLAAVNEYCSSRQSECCAQFNENSLVDSGDNTNLELATPDQTYVASGYPQDIGEDRTRVKIILKVAEDEAIAQCPAAEERRKKRSTGQLLFLDKNIIAAAVEDQAPQMAEDLGYRIEDVFTAERSAESDESETNTALIAGLAAGGGLLLMIGAIVAFVCYRKKQKGEKKEEYEDTKTIASNAHTYAFIADPYSVSTFGKADRPKVTTDQRKTTTDESKPKTVPNAYTSDPTQHAFSRYYPSRMVKHTDRRPFIN